jgi:hypothetical protein
MEAFYIATREDLIEQYLTKNPDATWEAAFATTADEAFERCVERLADVAYFARTRVNNRKQRNSDETGTLNGNVTYLGEGLR